MTELSTEVEITPPPAAGVLLEARGVGKVFPGVRALNNVDFTLRGGEVHALVGCLLYTSTPAASATSPMVGRRTNVAPPAPSPTSSGSRPLTTSHDLPPLTRWGERWAAYRPRRRWTPPVFRCFGG